MKYDFKKMAAVEFNSTKRPKQVVVPSHSYFEIHGTGNPNGALFPDYIAALYSVASLLIEELGPKTTLSLDYAC